jgi:5-formyltetrahydrofolate cyclo-ligase
VGFQIQICPEIPTETHDQSVASVLTESGFLTP